MSILNRENNTEEIPLNTKIANRLKRQTIDTYKGLLGIYIEGLNSFWKHPTIKPEDIALALGQDGAEIFNLHSKLGDFLYEFNPEQITEAKKIIGKFTINLDGTITIINE